MFCIVVFILDIADDLFNQIFHGDQADTDTVFIQNDTDGVGAGFHIGQKIICFLKFIHIEWFTNNFCNIKIVNVMGRFIKEQIFYMQDADDIITGIFINRKSGVRNLHILLQQFIIRSSNRNHGHIGTGNHNITYTGISEVHYVCDHFLFFVLDNAFFLTDIYHSDQLIFGDGFGTFVCIHS